MGCTGQTTCDTSPGNRPGPTCALAGHRRHIPSAAGNRLAPVIPNSHWPSARSVSDRVVHTVGACHWINGLRRTRRGAGSPVRPPTDLGEVHPPVSPPPDHAGDGGLDPLEAIVQLSQADGRGPHEATAILAVAESRLSGQSRQRLPRPEEFGETEPVGVPQCLNITEFVGRWLVVVSELPYRTLPGPHQ